MIRNSEGDTAVTNRAGVSGPTAWANHSSAHTVALGAGAAAISERRPPGRGGSAGTPRAERFAPTSAGGNTLDAAAAGAQRASMPKRFHVVWTKPGQEDKAASPISLQLARWGGSPASDVLVPKRRERYHRRGYTLHHPVPLLPGCVLAAFNPAAVEWGKLAELPYVLGLLLTAGGDQPAPVLSDEIEHLLTLEAELKIPESPRPSRRGQTWTRRPRYRVTGGPFEGHTGPYLTDKGDEVTLGLHIFGGPVPVSVSKTLVVPA